MDRRLIPLGILGALIVLPWWVYPLTCFFCALGTAPDSNRHNAVLKTTSREADMPYRSSSTDSLPNGTEFSDVPTSQKLAKPGEILLDVPKLVGKSPSQIASILGPPEYSTEEPRQSSPGETYTINTYRGRAVKVFFWRGKPAAIEYSFYRGINAPYAKESLAHVGLPTNRQPIVSNDHQMRWENIPGYHAVHVFPGERLPDGRVGLFYVWIEIEAT